MMVGCGGILLLGNGESKHYLGFILSARERNERISLQSMQRGGEIILPEAGEMC